MNPLAISILRGIDAESDRIAAMPAYTYDTPVDQKVAISNLPRFGVRLDFAGWTKQEPTPSHRQACHRALMQLEAAGLVHLATGPGGRVTHARLTKAGREARSGE